MFPNRTVTVVKSKVATLAIILYMPSDANRFSAVGRWLVKLYCSMDSHLNHK